MEYPRVSESPVKEQVSATSICLESVIAKPKEMGITETQQQKKSNFQDIQPKDYYPGALISPSLDFPLDDWSPECPFSVHLWCPARNLLEPCCIYGAGVWGQCVVVRWYWAAVYSKRKSDAVGMMLSQFSIVVGEHLLNLLNSCESQSDEKSWEAGGKDIINYVG